MLFERSRFESVTAYQHDRRERVLAALLDAAALMSDGDRFAQIDDDALDAIVALRARLKADFFPEIA